MIPLYKYFFISGYQRSIDSIVATKTTSRYIVIIVFVVHEIFIGQSELINIFMKISKIPGLGRFGVFIDDVDLFNITDAEWNEIGQLHMKSLVTIIRNTNLDVKTYQNLIKKITLDRNTITLDWKQKYGSNYFERGINDDPEIDEIDRIAMKELGNMCVDQTIRVSNKRNENGDRIGMFAEGELLWHSNESGRLIFTPGVSLLGHANMIGSSTGFLTTTDYYENVSESFRSELDEMILLHRFQPGRINPGLNKTQDTVMYHNMCPQDDVEIPLIIQSPAGIKGLHYSVNTVYSIKGMTKAESDSVFAEIDKELFVEKYIYDHWYQSNTDLCLFDNSITLHRRLGDVKDRECYRLQHDYLPLVGPYNPYLQEEFKQRYASELGKYGDLYD